MILYIGNPEEKLLDLINKFIKAARYKNHAKFVSISILLQFTSIHCCCCVALVVSDSVRPHRRQPTRLPVPGIFQARTLEWVAISFSKA